MKSGWRGFQEEGSTLSTVCKRLIPDLILERPTHKEIYLNFQFSLSLESLFIKSWPSLH